MKFQKLFFIAFSIFSLPIISSGQTDMSNGRMPLEDGVPVVNCGFNGDVALAACSVDTGSAGSHLPPELFRQSENYSSGKNNRYLTASGTVRECKALNLSSLTIDNLNLNTAVVDKCSNSTYGVIGVSAFEGRTWTFNFKKGFLQESHEGQKKGQALIRDSDGYVYVPVKIGNIVVSALFDTGITSGGAVDPIFVKANPDLFRFKGKISAQDPSGTKASYEVYEMNSLDLGNGNVLNAIEFMMLDQPAMWKVFNKAGAPVLLGMGVLSHFSWHIDLKNNLWSIE